MYFARLARVSILYDIMAILSLRAERGKRCDTRFAVALSEPVADADFPLSGVRIIVSRHSLLPRCGNSYGHKNMEKILKNFTGSRVLSPVTYSHDGTIPPLSARQALRHQSRCFTRDVDLPRSCVSFYTG